MCEGGQSRYLHRAAELLAILGEEGQSLKVVEESWLEFVLVPQFRDIVKTQLSSCMYLCLEGDGTVVWAADSLKNNRSISSEGSISRGSSKPDAVPSPYRDGRDDDSSQLAVLPRRDLGMQLDEIWGGYIQGSRQKSRR